MRTEYCVEPGCGERLVVGQWHRTGQQYRCVKHQLKHAEILKQAQYARRKEREKAART